MSLAARLGVAVLAASALVAVLASPSLASDRLVIISSGSKGTVAGKGGPVGTDPQTVRRELRSRRPGLNPLRTEPGAAGPDVKPGSAGAPTAGAEKAKSQPELLLDWEGLNHRDSRLADGGNQFSGEPADQGVCAGNGFVLETVNSALRVYDAGNGSPASNVLSLNEFYGFPPAIDRTTLTFPGPNTFDISCHYDPETDRWFHLALSFEQDVETGAPTGPNHLELAVSHSGDPRGEWTLYRIPAQNDGTEGTPDHGCTVDEPDGTPVGPGPCLGDFPHIGVDDHGVYITTNEFEFFGNDFIGAQVYALSKHQLVSLPMSIGVTLFNTADDPVRTGEPGFTVWPALSPGTQFASADGGTEYFVSSNAVFDDTNADSEELILWRLVNTSSLNSGTPSLTLQKSILASQRYAVPSNSTQKDGTTPLRDCLADTALSVPIPPPAGPLNCGAAFLGLPPVSLPLGTLDSGDSRVLDVRYANGKLWAVLGTAAQVGEATRTGAAWFILNPSARRIDSQGVLALADENLIYPTLGVTNSGRGVMGFTRVGPNTFPSYGFASIDARVGAGPVGLVEAGKSPQDGFTEYPPIGGNRPRWGDYGASAVDGNTVYVAGQYIETAPCTLQQAIASGFSCGGKRTIFGNWSTRIGKLKP
jgi:hypothetical protein